MIRAGGLWKNKDRNGNSYLAGNLGGLRVIVFPVKEKRGDKSPDYVLCFDENKPKDGPRDEREDEPGEDDDTPF